MIFFYLELLHCHLSRLFQAQNKYDLYWRGIALSRASLLRRSTYKANHLWPWATLGLVTQAVNSIKVAAARPPCTCRAWAVLTARRIELLTGGPLVAQIHRAWGQGTHATRLMLQLSAVLWQLLCSGRLRNVSNFAPMELYQDGYCLLSPLLQSQVTLCYFLGGWVLSWQSSSEMGPVELQEAINDWPAKPPIFSTACCGYLGSSHVFLQEPLSLQVRIR